MTTGRSAECTPADRVRLVLLARIARSWKDALVLVKPDTILRWHRAGFRLLWRRKLRAKERSPRIPLPVVELIQDMAKASFLWGLRENSWWVTETWFARWQMHDPALPATLPSAPANQINARSPSCETHADQCGPAASCRCMTSCFVRSLPSYHRGRLTQGRPGQRNTFAIAGLDCTAAAQERDALGLYWAVYSTRKSSIQTFPRPLLVKLMLSKGRPRESIRMV